MSLFLQLHERSLLFAGDDRMLQFLNKVFTNFTHIYYCASDGEFKHGYNNHTNSFRDQDYENKTELSKHIEHLKPNETEFNLK